MVKIVIVPSAAPPTPTPRDELAERLSLAPRALPEDTRRSNRGLILRALHHGGPASRADLAKLIGVTAATASSVIKDLHDAGLVEELGRTSGSVGKPATMIGIAPGGRHIVAISLSKPDEFVGALVDLSGAVVERRTYARQDRTGAAALELVRSIRDELVDAAERPILGIGIASPGIVDTDGTVVRAARLGWQRLPLAHALGVDGGVVHVANDANASALAELTFGTSNVTNFVLVRVDQGVGAGLVLKGELLIGAAAAAGEIGHVVVQPDGDECTCGKRGCLETKISAPLLQQVHDGADDDVVRLAGAHLGAAFASILSALDVADVVLSGPSQVATGTFRDAVRDAVADRTLPELSERLVVRPSSVGDDIVLGAAALVLDRELGIR
jgi:predicted NBD/HSP70 family sugar kinase